MRRYGADGSCRIAFRHAILRTGFRGKEQGAEVFRADLRRVFHEAIEGRVTGSYGDNGKGIGARGCDIGGRIADDDNRGVLAGEFACSHGGCGDHCVAALMRIAETAEGEMLAQTGTLELEPTDGFKVAGGDAEPFAGCDEMA